MGRRRDESGLTIKMLKTYVPEYHFNQRKEWTINDIKYALNSNDKLVVQSLVLGRSIASIMAIRKRMRG